MKKVGIITFHKSLNYGSAMQAWALSYYIKELGYDVKIIDYTPNNYSDYYSMFWKPTSLGNIKSDILHLAWLPFLKRREKGYSEFTKNHLPISEKKYKENEEISDFVSDKDIMLCGSDQIWNPLARDFSMNFFLSNCTCKRKISYAPSIGNRRLEDANDPDLIRKCLLDFDYISVREQSGADNINEFLNGEKKAEVVLDPTLLLKASDYNEITCKRRINKPYIFFYSVWYNPSAVRSALVLSKKYRLPIYTMMSGRGNSILFKNMFNIKFPPLDGGPSGFLSMIRNAKYVVTDSFHGTAFSVIFEKKFVAINNKNSDGTLKNDTRICNLLNVLDLESRYLTEEDVKEFDIDSEINYTSVTNKRLNEAEKSKDFLKRALGFEDK